MSGKHQVVPVSISWVTQGSRELGRRLCEWVAGVLAFLTYSCRLSPDPVRSSSSSTYSHPLLQVGVRATPRTSRGSRCRSTRRMWSISWGACPRASDSMTTGGDSKIGEWCKGRKARKVMNQVNFSGLNCARSWAKVHMARCSSESTRRPAKG